MSDSNHHIPYPHGLAKAFNEGRGWRYATFLISAIALGLLGTLIYVSTHQTTILEPYNISSAAGPVKVSPGSSTNGAYLSYVAQADLGLVLDWTPDTVKDQLDRFMNRLTPGLYAQEQSGLIAAAKLNKKNDITEAFYPHTVQYSGNTVQVTGLLVRYAGSILLSSTPQTYALTYSFTQGTPYVAQLTKTN
ncbi:hypothetical protein A6M27_17005 [Acidithiobacillus thiooxidans]|uniref:Conjugal transfer protein TraE n=1 Tax=Acidithiobacillus thiooxidans TaxID=930 RepID=A0A1C2HY80_ACITH|nr:TraE/TraK family type IV conjugative transfer system protein [Acidithiobacillus thiooxidans]OCX68693.1 hypothetical protein A6P07_17715 [Acidithiobacillus thiooxidans]OCX71551.1 hypothetical protein A6O24_15315 [Acidithiobacillus thiooxidans]OCX81045.1 hypothetical protein A6O26_13715 [Acidithiobacillus thiooxidans]OCX83793.1 hypothetical protein A6M27_17005 [Acidithiobacillus thiooxidans]OFC50279.1 hypothetical protein BAE47_02990 [Acidithiobacillus thiooxidans]